MVNGMLIDTAEEANKRPMAIKSGLRSGLASAAIFLSEEAPCGPRRNIEAKEASENIGAGSCCVGGLDDGVS